MFKSKLQEYCHSKSWQFPVYTVTRQGPDHCPSFQATVQVNGLSFASPVPSTTSKLAQNVVANLAYDFFTGGSSTSLPPSTSPAISSAHGLELQQDSLVASCDKVNRATNHNIILKDGTHMYKNQLQIYAQKRNLELPVYSVERVGPPHACEFKGKVTLKDQTYESVDYFSTIKEAESAAAKLALASIFPGGFEEDNPLIYKNLLQEMLQKEISCLPIYNTTLAGPPHAPVCVSTVEIQGETFKGREAKTKKQAEMNVAKVAYITLQERRCKQDKSVKAVAVHIGETFQVSSVNIPEGSSDMQTKNNKQAMASPSNSLMGMPEVISNTISKGSQNVIPTQSAPGPVSFSNDPSPSIHSNPVDGLHDTDKVPKKKKKKILVLPQSAIESHPNAPVLHSDDKWISFLMSP